MNWQSADTYFVVGVLTFSVILNWIQAIWITKLKLLSNNQLYNPHKRTSRECKFDKHNKIFRESESTKNGIKNKVPNPITRKKGDDARE